MKLSFTWRAVALLFACSLAPYSSFGAEVIELHPYTEVFCAWETRGEADPEKSCGKHGEQGRCQIKLETARSLGYTGTEKELRENRWVNEKWANELVLRCNKRFKYPKLIKAAYCYNAGHNFTTYLARNTSREYAKKVALFEAYRHLERQKRIQVARNQLRCGNKRCGKG